MIKLKSERPSELSKVSQNAGLSIIKALLLAPWPYDAFALKKSAMDVNFTECFLSIFQDDHMYFLLWTFDMLNSTNGFYNVIFCIPRLYPTADECLILLIFAELICLYFNISHLHL